jgi:hypothetical protein
MSRDTHLPRRHDIALTALCRPFHDRQRFSWQIKWTICIGFSVDFTLNVLLAFRNYLR